MVAWSRRHDRSASMKHLLMRTDEGSMAEVFIKFPCLPNSDALAPFWTSPIPRQHLNPTRRKLQQLISSTLRDPISFPRRFSPATLHRRDGAAEQTEIQAERRAGIRTVSRHCSGCWVAYGRMTLHTIACILGVAVHTLCRNTMKLESGQGMASSTSAPTLV